MRVRLIIGGVVALALALVVLPASALAGTYVEPFTVVSGAGNQGEPAVGGSVVLWVDDSSGDTVIQRRYLPPTDPAATISTDTTGSRHHPAYSEGLAVWWDSRNLDGDIWAYSVLSGHEFFVFRGAGEQVEPSTSEGYVVWQDDSSGDWDIWGAVVDPATDAIKDVFPVYVGVGSQTHPVVDGDTVVWQDDRNGNWDVYGARLTAVDATDWTAGPSFAVYVGARRQTWPSTDGTTVVWQDYRNKEWDIYGATIGAGLTPGVTPLTDPVCAAFAAQTHPQVAGELAVWQDMRDTQASVSYGADIWARDEGTDTEFPIVVAKGDQVLPSLSGRTVVWEDARSGDSDVYGATVTPWSIWVQIGDGSAWTKTRNITIYVNDPGPPPRGSVTSDAGTVDQMIVYDDGSAPPPWVAFAPSVPWTLPAGDGRKTIDLQFTDHAANLSPLVKKSITLDGTPPVTKAPDAASVLRGTIAKLHYRVIDALSPKAGVTIKIRTLGGAPVKTLYLGKRATGEPLTARFLCTLAKKKYRFSVHATDLAGNAATSIGSNYLTVQ